MIEAKTDVLIERTIARIRMTHRWLITATEDLTEAQFTWLPGPQAPPIGWHLWHMGRWADIIQSTLPDKDGRLEPQFWQKDELHLRWELDPSLLGPLQTGEGMAHEHAAAIPHQLGKQIITEYAQTCFAALDSKLDLLSPADVYATRRSVQAYRITEDRCVVAAPAPEVPLAADLTFHFSHASRHLGMMEALRGVLGFHGTISA